MTATEGMADDYDHHSQYQRAVADTAATLIAQSVDALPVPDGETFVVADYGSSTGANSICRGSYRDRTGATSGRGSARRGNPQRPADERLEPALPQPHHLSRQLPPAQRTAGASACLCGVVLRAGDTRALGPSRGVVLGCALAPRATQRRGARRLLLLRGDGRGARSRWRRKPTPTGRRSSTPTPPISPRGGRLLVQMVGSEPGIDGGGPKVTARKLFARWPRSGPRWPTTERSIAGRSSGTSCRCTHARSTKRARRSHAPTPRCTTHSPRSNAEPTPWRTRISRSGSQTTTRRRTQRRMPRSYAASPSRASGNTSSGPVLPAPISTRVVDQYFTRLTARFATDPERDRFEDWTLTVVLARN